jgi:hypothetical protein
VLVPHHLLVALLVVLVRGERNAARLPLRQRRMPSR